MSASLVARRALVVAGASGLALVGLVRVEWYAAAGLAVVTLQVAFWTAVIAAVMAWRQRRRRPSASTARPGAGAAP